MILELMSPYVRPKYIVESFQKKSNQSHPKLPQSHHSLYCDNPLSLSVYLINGSPNPLLSVETFENKWENTTET